MKTSIIKIYVEAIKLAQENNQVVEDDNKYYITIEQLEALIKLTDKSL